MVVVWILLDVDDCDAEHGAGWESCGVAALVVVALQQVRLGRIADAVSVHADATVRVRAPDQRVVWVLRVEACAVELEVLVLFKGLDWEEWEDGKKGAAD